MYPCCVIRWRISEMDGRLAEVGGVVLALVVMLIRGLATGGELGRMARLGAGMDRVYPCRAGLRCNVGSEGREGGVPNFGVGGRRLVAMLGLLGEGMDRIPGLRELVLAGPLACIDRALIEAAISCFPAGGPFGPFASASGTERPSTQIAKAAKPSAGHQRPHESSFLVLLIARSFELRGKTRGAKLTGPQQYCSCELCAVQVGNLGAMGMKSP